MQLHNSCSKSKKISRECYSSKETEKLATKINLMLEGKEFVCFISLRTAPRGSKGMKLSTAQGFAAQNPSTENIMSVLHKYKRQVYLSKRKPFLQIFISIQKKLKFWHSQNQVQSLTSLKKFDFK